MPFSFDTYPLGDTAITIEFGSVIDEAVNKHVLSRFNQLLAFPLRGMLSAIPSYSSLTIEYDIFFIHHLSERTTTAFEFMDDQVRNWLNTPVPDNLIAQRNIRIPVCYEDQFAPDKEEIINHTGLDWQDIVAIHCNRTYRVFMIGFLPGFPYMGVLDSRLVMTRKKQPVEIQPGSIGIAGRQTGIYPFQSPGGWAIIGRTPIQIFNASEESPSLIQPGDNITFYPISASTFLENQTSIYGTQDHQGRNS